MTRGPVGAYAVEALPPMPAFPPDPRAALRRRAVDRLMVTSLGPVRAIQVASSADAAVGRATLMLGLRDDNGGYRYTATQVAAALSGWHGDHHYPYVRGSRS